MPEYVYKAKNGAGELITGTLEADSRVKVTARLQSMGYFPINIRDKDGEASVGITSVIRKPAPKTGKNVRVRTTHVTNFYRQMSDLVGAGVPLVKALGIIKMQVGDLTMQSILSQVDRDVQGGDTFSQALGKHPRVFNKLSTAMIHAGESGGMLDDILNRLADFAESEEEIRSKVKSALAYPVVMVLAGIGVIIVLMTFVIPKIVNVFTEMEQTLPAITQILITTSDFISSYWYLILGGLILAVVGMKKFMATEGGKRQVHTFVLKVPVLGEIFLKQEVARFTRTLGSLLKNGVPILTALDISREVLSNVAVADAISKVPEGIAEGKGIAGTLRTSAYFPPVVANMIAIGEETGNLPHVLLRVADTYEIQVDRAVKTLTSLLEPIIILAMGLIVGFIVIAMLLPIFELDPTGG